MTFNLEMCPLHKIIDPQSLVNLGKERKNEINSNRFDPIRPLKKLHSENESKKPPRKKTPPVGNLLRNSSHRTLRKHIMASLLIGAGALLGGGVAARMGLRSLARNGTKLPPFLAAVAGQKSVGDEWVKGGFQAKMDQKEAAEILGLR